MSNIFNKIIYFLSNLYTTKHNRYDIYYVTGESAKHEFQSETQMLLQIVAKSLYSDKEVIKY